MKGDFDYTPEPTADELRQQLEDMRHTKSRDVADRLIAAADLVFSLEKRLTVVEESLKAHDLLEPFGEAIAGAPAAVERNPSMNEVIVEAAAKKVEPQKHPFNLRMLRGFLWPAGDQIAESFLWGELPKLDLILRHWVRDRRVAIQAGGNVGLFPKYLSPLFETVYTFEPDPRNFYCLSHNAPEQNVIKMQLCLGQKRGFASLVVEERNHGGTFMVPGNGVMPVVPLDNIAHFENVDLIYLDIEGYEQPAILGALDTIARCRPVIVIEDNGLWRERGFSRSPLDIIREHCPGYDLAQQIQSDFVFVPTEKVSVQGGQA